MCPLCVSWRVFDESANPGRLLPDFERILAVVFGNLCKLASLTAEVAPVKSPKDHVATRGPGTPKVHHGTQNAVQVVVHLRNTQASSRKVLFHIIVRVRDGATFSLLRGCYALGRAAQAYTVCESNYNKSII